LWWNSELAAIINDVVAGMKPSGETVVKVIFIMAALMLSVYIKSLSAGYACEYLSHDLRMGYAKYFSSLPFLEVEKLNAGEQLSKLQNEISGVSNYFNSNLYQLFDDSIKFIFT